MRIGYLLMSRNLYQFIFFIAVDTASVTEIMVGLLSHLAASSLKRSEAASFSPSTLDMMWSEYTNKEKLNVSYRIINSIVQDFIDTEE